MAPITLKEEFERLEARKAEIARELTAAPEAAPRLHPNLSEIYRRKVANLEAALEDDELRAGAAEALRALIEEIRLTPDADGGTLQVELFGELAALLALTNEHPRGVSSGVRVP